MSSLALLDPASDSFWLFDASPDIAEQLRRLRRVAPSTHLAGVFVTHAHIGHYTGLAQFGREAMAAKRVPVHAMPRMRAFLETNGPWDQLVRQENIVMVPLEAERSVRLTDDLRVSAFPVPHRDEYSETVGFSIEGPTRRVTFIPDIDKWEHWHRPVEEVIARSDRIYLDGTFFSAAELEGRDASEIPHPFIEESLRRFARLPESERAKVRFIHLNHTNAALDEGSAEREAIHQAGCAVACEMESEAM